MVVIFDNSWYNTTVMANTRTEAFGLSDPEGDLGYIPRGGAIPSKKPRKPLTGKAGLAQADRIDAEENRKKLERASGADLAATPEEVRLESASQVHAIRREVLGTVDGHNAVAGEVAVTPVAEPTEPEYPAVEPGEQAKLF
jgi:hypothetical protein